LIAASLWNLGRLAELLWGLYGINALFGYFFLDY